MEVLGVLMLSGILPVLIWLVVSILLVKFVIRPTGSVGRRMFIKWMVFAALMILPFADEIAGRMYLNYLCENKAGFKVYRTVELHAEYWDKYGNPEFIEKNGNYHLDAYPPKYKVGTYSKTFHIDHSGYSIVDVQTEEVIGEVTDFRYWGGWMRRNISTHNSANSCNGGAERFENLITHIFMRDNRKQEKL